MRRDYFVYAAALSNCFEGNISAAKEIIDCFGSVEDIFECDRREAVEVCPPLARCAAKLFGQQNMERAHRDIEWALDHGVDIVTYTDSGYPRRLRECPDAPIILYSKGFCDYNRPRFIAIVGTRAATQYGRKYCSTIIEGLATCGIKPVVVSGLALGIDTYAHTFALRNGLDTVAVMGTGFDNIYPRSNEQLADEIMAHGAVLTEFSPFTEGYPVNFVRRNRIIAALADCTLVVESKLKGGGLITARLAQDYDRSVFAVPGRIDDNTFKGCNEIIEENIAAIVTGAGSIKRAMGWDEPAGQLPLVFDAERRSTASDALCGLPGSEARGRLKTAILTFLADHPESDISAICAATGCDSRSISLPLLELEMSGSIILMSGNRYRVK